MGQLCSQPPVQTAVQGDIPPIPQVPTFAEEEAQPPQKQAPVEPTDSGFVIPEKEQEKEQEQLTVEEVSPAKPPPAPSGGVTLGEQQTLLLKMIDAMRPGETQITKLGPSFADKGEGKVESLGGMSYDEYLSKFDSGFKSLTDFINDERWVFKKRTEETDCFTFYDDVRGLTCAKGTTTMSCASKGGLAYLLSTILDASLRPQWDDMCVHGEIVEQRLPYYRISYFQLKPPVPRVIDGRDLCLIGRLKFFEGGSLAVHLTTHDVMPPNPNYVRLIFLTGGYLFEPTGEKDMYRVTFCAKADPSGWLPSWLKSLVAWKQACTIGIFKQKYKL